MKQILVLGAGLVSRPMVRYLLEQTEMNLVLADVVEEKASKIIDGHSRGTAVKLDIEETDNLKNYISKSDIVVSLLPWILHPKIASLCLEFKKHFITASYVKEEMQALDKEAKEKGLLFLNEIGVDPGIDHMVAMKTINSIKKNGGQVLSFYSYCGGLPALESNNNPFGYKFSWSPEGAMLAATNDGKYLCNGKVIEVPGSELFRHYWLIDVPGAGVFEAYVNRDALPYLDIYNIKSAGSIYRGTLRNIGYCETWDYFKKLGLLNRQIKFDFNEVSPRQAIVNLIRSQGKDIIKEVADYLDIPKYSLTLKKLEWLDFFTDNKIPLKTASVFEMFAYALQKKLVYRPGEVDLLIQHHEFIGAYPDNRKEKIVSTMVDTGIQGGDTSMSRTVGLPVAIAARLIAEGKIDLKGVHIPVLPQIYEPVLNELENLGIKFSEQKIKIN